MRILIMLLLATQIQAQINPCDSMSYTVLPQQTLTVIGDQSGFSANMMDSTSWFWTACNSSTCYSNVGQTTVFQNIMPTDTVKLCYDVYTFSTDPTDTTCSHCDSLIYDGFSWVLFSMSNPVGIVEIQNKINNNKMYDLFGREILRPKGLYIQNNTIKYER